MVDQVYIEGLEVMTLIGVYDFERDEKQLLILDLHMDYDCADACKSDQLENALDYDGLSKLVRSWSVEQKFQLIETYGQQLCDLLNHEFGIKRTRLKINKPAAVQGCTAVGIVIERHYS